MVDVPGPRTVLVASSSSLGRYRRADRSCLDGVVLPDRIGLVQENGGVRGKEFYPYFFTVEFFRFVTSRRRHLLPDHQGVSQLCLRDAQGVQVRIP